MRDPRRVSNQTWLESTELDDLVAGDTGDGGWKTSVFAMAAPIPYAAALLPLMLSASAAASSKRVPEWALSLAALDVSESALRLTLRLLQPLEA